MIKISSKLNWSKFLISIIILVSAFSYLAIIAFQSATVYSYTVSELKVASIQDNGSLIRVTGKLLPESYVRLNDSPIAEFMLTDGVENVEAMHSGVLPDLFFNERSEIILEGTYSVSGVFDSLEEVSAVLNDQNLPRTKIIDLSDSYRRSVSRIQYLNS